MIICICHRISDRDIAGAVRQGCDSFDELQCELRVATACGACHDCAVQTFEVHAAVSGGAAPGTAGTAGTACSAAGTLAARPVVRHERRGAAA